MSPGVDYHRMLSQAPGVVMKGHFLLASGRHSDTFVHKHMITADPTLRRMLCLEIAHHYVNCGIEVCVAPVVGAVLLSGDIAQHLSDLLGGEKVYSLYADKNPDKTFYLRPGYAELVSGRRVLIDEDVFTTGGSVQGVIDCVLDAGGEVRGVSGIWNRNPGVVTAESLGVPSIYSLVEKKLPDWAPDECPLCAKGVPLDDPKKVKL